MKRPRTTIRAICLVSVGLPAIAAVGAFPRSAAGLLGAVSKAAGK